mgnify:CR=1 FL=1
MKNQIGDKCFVDNITVGFKDGSGIANYTIIISTS